MNFNCRFEHWKRIPYLYMPVIHLSIMISCIAAKFGFLKVWAMHAFQTCSSFHLKPIPDAKSVYMYTIKNIKEVHIIFNTYQFVYFIWQKYMSHSWKYLFRDPHTTLRPECWSYTLALLLEKWHLSLSFLVLITYYLIK